MEFFIASLLYKKQGNDAGYPALPAKYKSVAIPEVTARLYFILFFNFIDAGIQGGLRFSERINKEKNI